MFVTHIIKGNITLRIKLGVFASKGTSHLIGEFGQLCQSGRRYMRYGV